jgi:hypothetical protein
MVRILTGDCREVLRVLPAESVHCVVTSPRERRPLVADFSVTFPNGRVQTFEVGSRDEHKSTYNNLLFQTHETNLDGRYT